MKKRCQNAKVWEPPKKESKNGGICPARTHPDPHGSRFDRGGFKSTTLRTVKRYTWPLGPSDRIMNYLATIIEQKRRAKVTHYGTSHLQTVAKVSTAPARKV